MFDAIHSIDSLALVGELERQREKRGHGNIDAFVQVNVSGEAAKFGCPPGEAATLAEVLARCRHVRLAGLMTMAPFADNPEQARPYFRRLRALRDELQKVRSTQPLGHSATWPLLLSMGMSHDFEVAIEEGADVIRVGTALFGERTG